jgi:hypothetical protein
LMSFPLSTMSVPPVMVVEPLTPDPFAAQELATVDAVNNST